MTLQNNTRLPLTQSSVTTPNVDLQLYGDGGNIIVATGSGANLPRTFFGLCKGPCGFTLRDKSNAFDLRGRAHISIFVADVLVTLNSGSTIEQYPEDTPFPSHLTLGWVGPRPIHVVWATAHGTGRAVIITVYEPDAEEWDDTFRRRRT